MRAGGIMDKIMIMDIMDVMRIDGNKETVSIEPENLANETLLDTVNVEADRGMSVQTRHHQFLQLLPEMYLDRFLQEKWEAQVK